MFKKILLYFSLIFFISNLSFAQEQKTNLHPAMYWKTLQGKTLQCGLCPRRCVLNPEQRGICAVRINKDGKLFSMGYGNPVAIHVDPIEKKPFFHVMPGEPVFSLAVAGCNMRCLFCQNWEISQSKPDEAISYQLSPENIISKTKENMCRFIAYTYTEPTVFYEYMLDIAKLAQINGIKNTMHTCGYINQEPLLELLQYMDAINVDLKGFTEEFYQKMGTGASLAPILETIKTIKKQGVWLEITNLVISNQNDDPKQIREMCEWIRDNLGTEVPIHFSRFMPAFKLQNLPPTSVSKLDEAYKIATEVGLKYVYIGNIPGHPHESTYCPNCKNLIVGRLGYEITQNNIIKGKCKFCGYKIAGIWEN